jgi:hypothetical protein
MNIPDSVVYNAQGFIDNNLDFVDNDDGAILDANVEDVLEVLSVPAEVLDKVMVQAANERHDRMDLSLFTSAESVQLDLLTTLNRIRAPNVAFGKVMKWEIRSLAGGHNFRDVLAPSRPVVLQRMQERLKLDALMHMARDWYLPYPKRTINVILFDANAVFTLFLTYPKLSVDKNYISHNPDNPDQDPFAKPWGSPIGDINTGSCYRSKYDVLIKNRIEDMLLPCIFAIEKKIVCDIGGSGELSVELIIVSYGLMKHSI